MHFIHTYLFVVKLRKLPTFLRRQTNNVGSSCEKTKPAPKQHCLSLLALALAESVRNKISGIKNRDRFHL